MSSDASNERETPVRAGRSRRRLRRSGRSLLRVGAVLTAVALVVALLAGWATRSMLDNLRTNSAELLDGSATVTLNEGEERTLYVTGGLVTPGETVPTPVEELTCQIVGPDREQVPFNDLASQGQRVGIDTVFARFQVVGDFQAEQDGEHTVTCDGLGVVVAPEVGPASVLFRLGTLMLGSLGTFVGVTMLLIGGVLLLLVRREDAEDEDDTFDPDDAPPAEGADEWWEEGAGPPGDVVATAAVATGADDDYVDLSEEELAALSDEQIEEMVRSGALVFVDDEDQQDGSTTEDPR